MALAPTDTFVHRHIGPDEAEVAEMLGLLGYTSLDALIEAAVPSQIRTDAPLNVGPPRGEHELLAELKRMASKNEVRRSYIGMGYTGTIVPPVIQRNILENPGWYTQYTPYQAEISQGRLEALLNFQTMVSDLTALPLAGASLLDEGTAAAEAMAMCFAVNSKKRFIVADDCHPQTIAVVETRGRSMGVAIDVLPAGDIAGALEGAGGVLVQYPTTDGRVECYETLAKQTHDAGAMLVCACDLLALTLLKPPGEFGADIAIGSAQRLGVPMGFGGPHAAFMATKEEFARKMPGRIIGVSKDAHGNTAYRMAIQTREQHIKRDRATSNICTAQALLAIMASMYAVYHGPEGLRRIAMRIYTATQTLRAGLLAGGHAIAEDQVFDTLHVKPKMGAASVVKVANAMKINLRDFGDGTLGITLDETVTNSDIADLLSCFDCLQEPADLVGKAHTEIAPAFQRTSGYLTHPVFNTHHSETEMLRYIYKLQRRDLSLADSMIPLGSCTMKLNATSEMLPVTWPEFGALHPFAPAEQTRGYQEMFDRLEAWIADICGLPAVSLMPNAGSQGEYTGLLVIRALHESKGDTHRDVCLIPTSAHGTNPASAVIAGMRVVPIKCDANGNIDMADLQAKAQQHKDNLSALMVTYPSTHGVFEPTIKDICKIVHDNGGRVYMDGANLNAQVGLCRPGELGADVIHLNLHKTFCIPHGGGGPGMGPIACTNELAPFLPGHPVRRPASAGAQAIGPVSAAPYGSPSILTISYVYMALMGSAGLKRATEIAILNANYMAKRLEGHYDVVYRGPNGRVAHEFIIDCRAFDKSAGIKIDDIAKRLMDYGFHAPTMAWPVPGTLMIEPTESEAKGELDRFCDALIAIRQEIRDIEQGKADREDNVLKHAPHTQAVLMANAWTHPYTREQAGFPKPWLRDAKFWPAVGRIDNAYGDRHLVCTCPSVEEVVAGSA
ncbi:MAG: aminomethyl-transferring glycine dehydrogenase [Phycisphaeraceae bacterium]|nr:aminomethyl-transferring glycine dehydrogenase [Phycisphaeraceae bacterium]